MRQRGRQQTTKGRTQLRRGPQRTVRLAAPLTVLAILAVLAYLLFAPPPLAADDPLSPAHRARADRLTDTIEEYSAVSDFPLPAIDADHWRDLFRGGVVSMMHKIPMEDVDGEAREHRRIWALRLVDAPRVAAWLAALHPHFAPSDRVTEKWLETDDRGRSLWYQHIDLPWPVRSRHWVIRIRNALAIAAATEGRAWELSWDLEPGGREIGFDAVERGLVPDIDLDAARGSRYLIANTGAWTMFDLGAEGTLVAYQLTLVLGGWLPEALAARFARGELKSVLETVARNAPEVVQIYDPEEWTIRGGDGHAISLAEARAAATTRGSQTGSLLLDQFDPDIFMLGRPPRRR